MLPTTTEFDAAIDANTTEVDCKVEIEREYNAIANTINVTAVHDAEDPRFHKDNVVNIRNPQYNGIAYGPVREFFSSSTPLKGFRFIDDIDFDKNRDVAYYIPINSPDNTRADVTVDYDQNFEMNCIEIRYENSRTQNTTYDDNVQIYVTPNGGSETLVYDQPMKDDGVTRIYYDGTNWTEVKDDMVQAGANIQKVRLRVQKGTYTHQPRIMYIGGLHLVDVSDDIIDVSVNKTEFEQSTYLPTGDPSGNTCSVSLDNTAKRYRFGDQISNNYFLKNQRINIKFGVNTKYGEGADSFEYVSGGVFYVDDFGYDEKEMTVDISGQDFSKHLQEVFCGNYLWVDKSLKYIVYDVLARSGITPRGVIFDFGVAGNADETNIRPYTWTTDEQTVWDFLTQLAKSELGTVFYDEEENLVFTDRLDIEDKVTAGVQYTFDASTNLEDLEEKFEIGANKIKVNYEELALNSGGTAPQLIVDKDGGTSYVAGPKGYLNQVLWQPDSEEGYLGSATLSRTLKPGHTYLYVTKETNVQITREEGEVLIGDEFIKYNNRTTLNNGEGRLKIVERDSRNTVYNGNIPVYKGINSNYDLRRHVKYNRSKITGAPVMARGFMTEDGWRQRLYSRGHKYWDSLHCTEFDSSQIDYNSNYRIYSARFRFNKMPDEWDHDQAAGIYVNMNSSGIGLFFEVSNPNRPEIIRDGVIGNARAYKINNGTTRIPMPPDRTSSQTRPEDQRDGFGKTFLFEEAEEGVNDGTYIEMTVIQVEQGGADKILWYINGEYIAQFKTEYTSQEILDIGYRQSHANVGSSNCQQGRFGFFTRGSTDSTLDYFYASNDTTIGPDEVLQSKGFRKYFDTHTNSWQVKQDYMVGREYYVEFGAPVHEVVHLEAEHDTFPNIYSRILNTDEETVTVFKSSHDPFSSDILVGNTARIGVNLNDTVFYPDGTSLDHSFLVYGLGVVRSEQDTIQTSHAPAIRRYGIEEVEFKNPWVNSKEQAISLATHIRKFWSTPQQFFDLSVFPNPALQVRDRVNVLHTDKGFDGSGVWFVNGITLTYDGGLSSTVTLKRYEDYPTQDFDYREEGGIIIV